MEHHFTSHPGRGHRRSDIASTKETQSDTLASLIWQVVYGACESNSLLYDQSLVSDRN
jgi:hypothetical protein